jgi:chaperonin GroES
MAPTTWSKRVPPYWGCGWHTIAAARGASGSARSPVNVVPSDAANSIVRRVIPDDSLMPTDGTLLDMAPADDKLPIKMLNDRVLVRISDKAGERKSSGGIVIPATAQVSKRLIWATVVAQGQNVRSCEVGDKVLFSPEDRYEVEVQGEDYVMLRERELHAVAAERIEASTGLYL